MEINKFKESDDVSELLSGFKIAEYILQNVKNENQVKKSKTWSFEIIWLIAKTYKKAKLT